MVFKYWNTLCCNMNIYLQIQFLSIIMVWKKWKKNKYSLSTFLRHQQLHCSQCPQILKFYDRINEISNCLNPWWVYLTLAMVVNICSRFCFVYSYILWNTWLLHVYHDGRCMFWELLPFNYWKSWSFVSWQHWNFHPVMFSFILWSWNFWTNSLFNVL